MANPAPPVPQPGPRKNSSARVRPPFKVVRVHPLDLIAVGVRQRRMITIWALVFGALTFVAVYFFMSVKYESEVVIFPPAHPGEPLTGGTLLQLEFQLAGTQGVKKKDAQDFWGMVLTSRTVADYMIDHFDLLTEYKTTVRSAAARKLDRRTTFKEPTSGLISIKVKDPNPERAAQLTNGYVAALQSVSDSLAASLARQQQSFFQGQVDREKDQLQQAEKALTAMQQKTGIVTLRGQTGVAIGQISALKGKIQALKIEMEVQQSAETDEDPDMIRMRAEMDGLQAALKKLEQQNPGIEDMGDIGPNSLPGGAVDYMRAVRDLRYHESLYQALAKHAAGAQMDLLRKSPPIEVLEPAIPAEKPSSLPRWLDVLIGFIVGGCFGLFAGVLREFYRTIMRSPSGKYRRQLIRRELQKRPTSKPLAA